jgi:hypothetical protein
MSAEGEDGLDPVYPASSKEYIVTFNKSEKSWLFQAMLDVIPLFRASIRIFSPLSALYSLQQYYDGVQIHPFPCRGGKDYFYINASDGHTYPCGYRGMDNLGDYTSRLAPKRDKQNCSLCDWECFRDPSELTGPLAVGLSNLLKLMTTYKRDRNYYGLWFKDLLYYRSCDLFDGRKDINLKKLENFAKSDNKHTSSRHQVIKEKFQEASL